MTWLKFRGSSVHHLSLQAGRGGHYATACGLSFGAADRSHRPEDAHGERCYACSRKANPGAQPDLWEAAR